MKRRGSELGSGACMSHACRMGEHTGMASVALTVYIGWTSRFFVNLN